MNSKQPFICLDAVLLWSIMADSHPQQTMRMGSLKHHKLSRPSSKHQNSIPLSQEPHSKGTFKQICVIKASWLIKMVTFYCPFFYHPHPTFFIESELHTIPFWSYQHFFTPIYEKKSGLSPWYSWFVNEVQSNFIISN